MDYSRLGGTGLSVSRFGLGAMSFGSFGNSDHDDCVRIIRTALDNGVNVVDTADMYSRGESEVIVGKALAGRRDDVIVSSKCYWPMSADPNHRGGSRLWIMRAIEASLARLATDRLDVFYLHKPDTETELVESLSALTDLIRQGKVVIAGISTFPPSWIVEAHWCADQHHLVPPRVEQPPYSILTRSVERDVFATVQRLDMGVLTWGPLDGGWLTGKYSSSPPPRGSRARRWSQSTSQFDPTLMPVQRKQSVVRDLQGVADDAGCTLTHLALAFCAEHPAVSTVLLGPRTMDQLVSLLGAADLRLDHEILDRIDELVPPGENVDATHGWGWEPPWLTDPSLRRRSAAVLGTGAPPTIRRR